MAVGLGPEMARKWDVAPASIWIDPKVVSLTKEVDVSNRTQSERVISNTHMVQIWPIHVCTKFELNPKWASHKW